VFGFSGHDRDRRGCREPKTPHRKARLSSLSRGIVSAPLPAYGRRRQYRLIGGPFPPANLIAFSAPVRPRRRLPAGARASAYFEVGAASPMPKGSENNRLWGLVIQKKETVECHNANYIERLTKCSEIHTVLAVTVHRYLNWSSSTSFCRFRAGALRNRATKLRGNSKVSAFVHHDHAIPPSCGKIRLVSL
jgi:hypothetical protein